MSVEGVWGVRDDCWGEMSVEGVWGVRVGCLQFLDSGGANGSIAKPDAYSSAWQGYCDASCCIVSQFFVTLCITHILRCVVLHRTAVLCHPLHHAYPPQNRFERIYSSQVFTGFSSLHVPSLQHCVLLLGVTGAGLPSSACNVKS
uniref:Uncharacterized protein n=1 Tax=Ascaris lumbricoides TaxID=6252 RepID=A0A0M3I1H4_ASCLU